LNSVPYKATSTTGPVPSTAQRLRRFLRKSPSQMWEMARFFRTMWLSKVPYIPHKVRLSITAHESIAFWWSYFPASFRPDRTLFDYWGDDIGDLRFLWRYLRQGMIFLDIGAYHGVFSIVAAKKLGPSGRIVAFEPSPRERQKLLLHLRYNRIQSVTAEPYALAADEGQAQLSVVVDGFTTMNSLRTPPINHPTRQVTVDTITLDSYLKHAGLERADLMKIDTEGGEVDVFRGARRLLSEFRPIVICEVLDLVTRGWGYPASQIVASLRAYDYEWFDILPDGSLSPHRARDKYPEGRNYLAVPREKRASLETLNARVPSGGPNYQSS